MSFTLVEAIQKSQVEGGTVELDSLPRDEESAKQLVREAKRIAHEAGFHFGFFFTDCAVSLWATEKDTAWVRWQVKFRLSSS